MEPTTNEPSGLRFGSIFLPWWLLALVAVGAVGGSAINAATERWAVTAPLLVLWTGMVSIMIIRFDAQKKRD